MKISDLFLKTKTSRMLILLKDTSNEWYISKLAKRADATYVYTTKIVRQMEQFGLIKSNIRGREKLIKLTERGLSLASSLDGFVKKSENTHLITETEIFISND